MRARDLRKKGFYVESFVKLDVKAGKENEGFFFRVVFDSRAYDRRLTVFKGPGLWIRGKRPNMRFGESVKQRFLPRNR